MDSTLLLIPKTFYGITRFLSSLPINITNLKTLIKTGKAFITPEEPKAVDGKSVSMRCGADPPGFPAPEYRWWKEGSGDSSKTLARGSEFTIDFATLDSAGKYFCRPVNELGEGTVASARLDVYQVTLTKT